MADVKALFPIGKTQWSKWSDDQRTAFNEARAAGLPYNDAFLSANQTQTAKKNSVFDIIEDVAEVAVAVAPMAAVAKTVVKAAVKKAK
jgi:hypothetical protein